MKSKKKPQAKMKSKANTHRKTKTKKHIPRTRETSPILSEPSPNLTLNISPKTCQEMEVGDIGGFGSTTELEEHEKRCSEPATEFCSDCGKNFCHNHYDLLHRDHDHSSQNSTISQA